MTTHTDSMDCNCLIRSKPNAYGCQFVNCDGGNTGDIITFTDGTVMHVACTTAYDRQWHNDHPVSSEEMMAQRTEVMERRAGA